MSYFEKVSTITVLTPNARDMAITALFDAAYAGVEVPTLKPEEKKTFVASPSHQAHGITMLYVMRRDRVLRERCVVPPALASYQDDLFNTKRNSGHLFASYTGVIFLIEILDDIFLRVPSSNRTFPSPAFSHCYLCILQCS